MICWIHESGERGIGSAAAITKVFFFFFGNESNYEFNIQFLEPNSGRCDICEGYRIWLNNGTAEEQEFLGTLHLKLVQSCTR